MWVKAIFLLLAAVWVHGQDKCEPPEDQKEVFPIAQSGAIARQTEATSNLRTLISFVEFVDRAVTSAADSWLSKSNPPGDVVPICNHGKTDGWKGGVNQFFALRGWECPNADCVSDVYGAGRDEGVSVFNEDEDGWSSDEIYEVVVGRAKELNSAAEKVRNDVMGNWTSAERASEFEYDARTQFCTHDYAGFVKVGEKWYVDSRLTNAQRDVALNMPNRQYLDEFLRIDEDGKVEPLVVEMVNEGGEMQQGTTTLKRVNGVVTASAFTTVYARDNIAVKSALRKGEHETQQASDATTPSNIAILALPLAMNLVPVALVAEVNSFGMLFYTLVTDVLTAVPLAIKGVEVLAIGSKAERAVVTRITGANRGTGAKAAEVWVAQCEASGNLRPTGIALLCVAIVFMVGGIVAEFVAKSWVQRRKKMQVDYGIPFGGVGSSGAAAMVMSRTNSKMVSVTGGGAVGGGGGGGDGGVAAVSRHVGRRAAGNKME